MNDLRLTERGWRVVTWAALLGFLMLLGVAGWIEGLA